MAEAEAVPSTPMELVSRLTEQEVTPGTLFTAFSTRALQAAQLMPVTLYCSIINSSFEYSVSIPTDCSAHSYLRRQVHIRNTLVSHFISFCKVATSSSMVSFLPSRISLATQVRM